MNYIKAAELINIVKVNLKSYFESGIVDESILYPEILFCLGKIGTKILPRRTMIFQLNAKETKLPEDFHSLIYAVGCKWEVQPTYSLPVAVTYEKRVCELPICHSETSYCHDEKGRYQIIQKIDQGLIKYQMQQEMILDAKSSGCDSCFNPKRKNEWDISIENNILYTQRDHGTVFIEYFGKLEEDGEIIIPDYVEITNWIKWHLMHHVLQLIWYNMDSDTYQRYQDSIRNLHVAHENAKSFWKRNSFQTFKELKSMLSKEFSNFAQY